MIRASAAVVGLVSTLAGCTSVSLQHADAMSAVPPEPLGEDRLSLKWRFATDDRRTEIDPQEFAQAAVAGDTVFVGSQAGWFFALGLLDGHVRWKKQIGAVTSQPVVVGTMVYIGTADGILMCLDSQTGAERWRYQSRGPVEQPPKVTLDLVVFANEADQIVALDGITGRFKWQYKSETPEEYTLRGHAGVAIDGALIYTGFSNGTLVALRKDTGTLAWSTSLKAEADRFIDVDATPIVVKDRVYATSSSGGVYALDKATGLVRWRLPFYDAAAPSATGNIGGLASDGDAIYVSVADLGTYAIDLGGNVLWRVGAKGGGEPAEPVISDELLVYSLATDGMFIADKKTGETLEYFDPGDGISAPPTITGDGRLFVMSNRGILYAFDLE